MEMRIYGTAEDSIVDGPGLRYVVFAQGCPHHCPGCHNPESHDFAGGRLTDTAELIRMMQRNPLLDGLTLSGGEPMCQPEACLELALAAKEKGLNVWCYTGYTWEVLQAEGREDRIRLLDAVDVLVDGPFVLAKRSLELTYCGSGNQRLIDVARTKASGEVVLWHKPVW